MRRPSFRSTLNGRATALALAAFTIVTALAPTANAATPASTTGGSGGNGGSFRLDKNKTSFAFGCGYRVPAPEDGNGTKRVVVLASKAMDCAAADTGFDPVQAIEQTLRDQKADYVVLTVAPEGRVDGNWTSADPSDGFSFGGQGTPELKQNTDQHVTGRTRTDKPESFFDKTFEFDLRFDVALSSGSLDGTKIPAGGGDAGKVVAAYVKAMQKPDVAALQKLVVTDQQGSFDMWSDKDFVKIVRSMELKEAKVTGGLQKGARVALDVDGKNYDGDAMRGRVFLIQEGGTWKIEGKALRIVF
jgi:hypothetical protein